MLRSWLRDKGRKMTMSSSLYFGGREGYISK